MISESYKYSFLEEKFIRLDEPVIVPDRDSIYVTVHGEPDHLTFNFTSFISVPTGAYQGFAAILKQHDCLKEALAAMTKEEPCNQQPS